ncbi:MAG: insulinase family protein [Planctomycetes bacterium]|nr:insulinase family protein [Planctomycetota bacterium]
MRFRSPSAPPRPTWARSAALSLLAALLCLAAPPPATPNAPAANVATSGGLRDLETQVVEHRLANGLRFLLLERHHSPTVAFHTYVDVGSVDEEIGQTGLAHMFEHMAFKGTATIGTRDWPAEEKAIAAEEAAHEALLAERRQGAAADAGRLAALEQTFTAAQEKSSSYVIPNEFSSLLERQGCTGLNAMTGADATQYVSSLPANKLEYWAYMESERFVNPVLREFYKERDVVIEERRMRTESQPIGKLLEAFLAVAFQAHPYRWPTIGYRSDLDNLTRAQAQAFYARHYVPGNTIIAIVGDFSTAAALPVLGKYFGRLPAAPRAARHATTEPPQEGERRVEIETQAQPVLGIGWHKPGAAGKDEAVYDALVDVLSGGRSSRLYRRLVKEQKLAMQTQAFTGLPGSKHPGLFIVVALPTVGHTTDELEKAIYAETARLSNAPPTDEELAGVKTRARAGFVRALESSSGLAAQLTTYEAITGSWRDLFRNLDKIDAVTGADCLRVAQETFTQKNRTVARLVTVEGEGE